MGALRKDHQQALTTFSNEYILLPNREHAAKDVLKESKMRPERPNDVWILAVIEQTTASIALWRKADDAFCEN